MSNDFGTVCLGWWRMLTDKNIGSSRSNLAQLRRAGSTVDALAIRAAHDLNRRLAAAGHNLQQRPERLALIVKTLAHVKEHTGERLAQGLGKGEPKALSELRFDRLIRTHDPAELAMQLRRALAAVGPGANVAQLARDLRWWDDSTRAAWCFDYYGASLASPENANNSKETEA